MRVLEKGEFRNRGRSDPENHFAWPETGWVSGGDTSRGFTGWLSLRWCLKERESCIDTAVGPSCLTGAELCSSGGLQNSFGFLKRKRT